MRTLVPLLALALAGPLALPAAAQAVPDKTGIFRGKITDSLGIPIPGAEISILKTELKATANDDGLFRIENVPPGLYAVLVRAIGWKPYLFLTRMDPDQEQVGRIGLEPAPQRLPDVEVSGKKFFKPPEYEMTHRYDDFFHRKLVRAGTFRIRGDQYFGRATHTGDLLMMIPGVHVYFGENGTTVEFARCSGPNAKVAVWIDGARMMTEDHNQALEYIRPSNIEMIEVYRSAGQIPGEFLADSCAAIVIWTR